VLSPVLTPELKVWHQFRSVHLFRRTQAAVTQCWWQTVPHRGSVERWEAKLRWHIITLPTTPCVVKSTSDELSYKYSYRILTRLHKS